MSMTRERGQNYESQRESILAGASELFAQRGYHGTTMNEVSEACGLSKATLYHYFRDKNELLLNIADAHVSRLIELCDAVRDTAGPSDRLTLLIDRFLVEYSKAQNSHRVLTEDVRFLPTRERKRILDKEREVVSAFADAILLVRPDLETASLETPIAMLLFGMLNWMFTWMKPDGRLTYAEMAPIVRSLFLRGLQGLEIHSQDAQANGVGTTTEKTSSLAEKQARERSAGRR
jgi:TetR/AcrR family transcriptional regulator